MSEAMGDQLVWWEQEPQVTSYSAGSRSPGATLGAGAPTPSCGKSWIRLCVRYQLWSTRCSSSVQVFASTYWCILTASPKSHSTSFISERTGGEKPLQTCRRKFNCSFNIKEAIKRRYKVSVRHGKANVLISTFLATSLYCWRICVA